LTDTGEVRRLVGVVDTTRAVENEDEDWGGRWEIERWSRFQWRRVTWTVVNSLIPVPCKIAAMYMFPERVV
jgi:hypothetical protein